MVFLAHTLLQLSPKGGRSIGSVEVSLKMVGSRCRHATMEVLRSFIELRLAQKIRTADEILRYTLSDLRELKTLYKIEIT
jgi:hypothetical protein